MLDSFFRKAFRRFLVMVLCAASSTAAAGKTQDRETLRRSLQLLLQQDAFKGARLAVVVQSLDDGTNIFAHESNALLNPASNVKLFTAAAALVRLGPDFRFETEFLTDGRIDEGKTRTLFVRGKGDPSLTTERLYGIVSELKHAGLREVTGDIVLDDSYFDGERLAPGFDQERTDRAYMAPTGALSLNWNAVGVYVRSHGHGRKPTVELEPSSDHFVVENGLTARGRRARRFSVSSDPVGDRQRIGVKGTVADAPGEWVIWKKIDQPVSFFGQTLKSLLSERGIKVRGKVKAGNVPAEAKLLHVAQSDTLDLVLKRLNKFSSNFVAEQLVKTLGAHVKGAPGTFAKGIDAIEDFLEQEVGLSRGSYVMKNGSGLNDTNRFSAAQHVKLLRFMYERFPLAPEYMSSMGIAGKDGTLRYRFEGSNAVGRLRAKTGTLENVSALSGYVQAVGGERFAFSVLVNDPPARLRGLVDAIDSLGAAIASTGADQAQPTLVATRPAFGDGEQAKARVKTYLRLAGEKDTRNMSFLRTAWRTEQDPAVRIVVADAIYQSEPEDYLGIRALLDSFSTAEPIYRRLRQLSRDLSVELPGMTAVIALAAEGHPEALSRLVELARLVEGDAEAQADYEEALSEVARTAGYELVAAFRDAVSLDRDAALRLLARGLVKTQDPDHPFWPSIRKMRGALDPSLASFAKSLEEALSLRIAQEKSPVTVVPQQPVESRP
ncbi:MAG: D-alanyl-D-alanine carboxypeptidase/D-alanyl-D-alanine-endopeptidase [Myxococcaceae bacterium]